MLTIILSVIGIVIFIKLLFFLSEVFDFFPTDILCGLSVAIVILGIAGIAAGIFYPISGYNDSKLIKKIPLVSLSNSVTSEGSGSLLYVQVSAENVYSFRYEIESKFGTETSKEYTTDTLSGNIIEVEDPNCTLPVLQMYKSKAKKTIWTFAIGSSEISYVFYVPKGTISKGVNLK